MTNAKRKPKSECQKESNRRRLAGLDFAHSDFSQSLSIPRRKGLAETGWWVYAYALMPNRYYQVVENPGAAYFPTRHRFDSERMNSALSATA